MKRTRKELEKELIIIYDKLKKLAEQYPRFTKNHLCYVPNDIRDLYDYYYSRIKNLKININQAKMRELNKI